MKPKMRTAGCFIEYENRFLLLHRHPDKPLGGTWGLPAGKVEHGESDLETIVRETFEETGIQVDPHKYAFLGNFTFDFSYVYLEFPTFSVQLSKLPKVQISPSEHIDYRWVTPQECFEMSDLIDGLHDLLIMAGYVPDSFVHLRNDNA
jgi:8-oxo-dGTP pyrophosphatase MutT (NUDIX family)